MAVEVERLIVTLEANLVKYRADLAQSQAVTNSKLAAMEARYASFASRLKNSTATAGAGIGTMLAGIGGALGTAAVIEYANAWTRITRSVDASGRVFGIALKPATELNALANDARVDLEAYSKLYIRTAAAIRDYGFAAGTAETVTSTLAKALKLGGANAGEQASVLLQFSQALQKGKLDGDEFRSVMENAGVVQELLADRLKVTKGEIIKLAADGKLQIRDLVGAMVDGAAKVDRIYKQVPQTIDEAFAVLKNNVTQFLGQADQATGASQAIANGIVTISQNLGAVAVAAGAILGSATVRMAAFAAASVAAANPLTLIAAAIGGLATAYGVFGDEVKVSADQVVSLKDAFAAFIDVAGGDARATMTALGDTFQAMREKTAEWGLTWANVTGTVTGSAKSLANAIADIDAKFGGFGASIANAFVSANKQLADALGLTSAINAALDKGNQVSERAQQIALARGIEEGKNLGQGLADYYAGKITNKRTAPPNTQDAKRSTFDREADQIRKRTEALKAEIATIGQSEYAQTKAKVAADLRFAAAQTASKEHRKVSAEELAAIEKLSEAYAQTQAQVAFLNKLQVDKDGIAEALQELELVGLYGQALDEARYKLELLNAAKRLGIKLTPERQAEIDETAKAKAAVDQYRKAVEDLKTTSADALKSFISDLREGKSASEALANALDRLATKFLDAGIDGLVNVLVGGVTKPGTRFASLFGFAGGGVFANGRPVNLPKFANGGVSNKAAIFGEAGPEAAVPLPDGRRIPVELRMPNIPQAVAPSAAPNLSLAVTINAPNATAASVGKMQTDLVPQIRKVVQTEVHEMFTRSARFAKAGL